MPGFRFRVLHKDKKTKARVGEIWTPHGVIKTPAFVPVGTQASVKSLTPEEMKDIGVQLFFVNTYHMYLRPGIETIEKLGGIHTFMGWDGPIITDSGGFQIYSLGRASARNQRGTKNITRNNAEAEVDVLQDDTDNGNHVLVKFLEDGIEFRSHWDGTKHVFTPENAMERQWKLRSDIPHRV